jgi:hypothetical protein
LVNDYNSIVIGVSLKPFSRWPWRHHSFALLFLLGLILVLRLGWGWYISHQIQLKLSDLRSKFQPTTPADLIYETVPDSENAWKLYLQAGAIVSANESSAPSPTNSKLTFPNYPPYTPAWHSTAAASEKASAEAFVLARRARQLERVQVHDHYPAWPQAIKALNYPRNLAVTLGDSAIYTHLNGNDGEALDRLLDLLHLTRGVRSIDFIIAQLVAQGLDQHSTAAAMVIAPSLRITPQTREQTKRLIEEFRDEGPIVARLRRGFQTERLLVIDQERARSASTWLIRPLAEQEILRELRSVDFLLEVVDCANFPAALSILSRAPPDPLPPRNTTTTKLPFAATTYDFPRYSRWFAQDFYLTAYMDRHFRSLAERRAAAIALAMALYRADHQRLPTRLEDLVPNYLPSVPSDPFQLDGRTIGYKTIKSALTSGADRPVLFFDPGGPDNLPPEPSYGWYWVRVAPGKPAVRQYRDLTLFSPALLKKTVNNNPNPANAPGNNPQPNNTAP